MYQFLFFIATHYALFRQFTVFLYALPYFSHICILKLCAEIIRANDRIRFRPCK